MADLARFLLAQENTYHAALAEIRAGRKTTHWMWYVFPQIAGLGHSAKAQTYALADISEAHDYAMHAILGPRLRQISSALLEHKEKTADQILGTVDGLKLRSCATLFEQADPGADVFPELLRTFFLDQRCPNTIARLEKPR